MPRRTRAMSRWSIRIAFLLLLGAVVALVLETRELAEQVGEAERRMHVADERAAAARRELDARPAVEEPAEPAAPAASKAADPEPIDLNEYARLKLALHESEKQVETLRKLVQQRNEQLELRAKAAAERSEQSLRAMPDGVRLCLETLHDCLVAEGYHGQRFLRAGSLDDEGLHDIELLDTSENGLEVAFLFAGLMTALVDRDKGRLELRFFKGHRTVGGERAELPEDGFALTFDEVDGRLFERRLPYLVTAQGAYPVEVDRFTKRDTDVDSGTRRQWLTRIKRLLAKSKLDLHWRATRLRGMQKADFLEVELVGTTAKGLVLASAHCDRLAIEVDDQAGVVSLLMRDGVLRKDGVESTISREGYRMLLPGLTPKDATTAMLGMVVKK